MSKKVEAIKQKVFYAQQDPEALAVLIADLVTDVATKVTVEGATEIAVPTGDESATADYTANVFSQFGDEMTETVTLSIVGTVTGVSISDKTVTVTKDAVDDKFTVKATCGDLTATLDVTLTPAD